LRIWRHSLVANKPAGSLICGGDGGHGDFSSDYGMGNMHHVQVFKNVVFDYLKLRVGGSYLV
jgi:hypothetical protein